MILMVGYIYCITNNVNGKQYVGKTTTSVKQRFTEHLRDRHKRIAENRPLYKAIEKYGEENFSVETLEEVEEDILSQREEYWIAKLGTYHNGYNATLGGDGKTLYNYKEIEDLLKQGMLTLDICKMIGCCQDTVYKVSKNSGIPLTIEKNNLANEMQKSKKSIEQYSLQEEYIQTFESCMDASRWLFKNGYCKTLNGGVRSHISDAAKGKRKTAYKFIWKFT